MGRIRVHQLLTNLLRNAFQHGDAHSTITLSPASTNKRQCVSVHNEGEPIPKELW